MTDWITTFLSVFFTDIFYTYYLKAVQESHALKASFWASVVFCIACVAVINYTSNHALLLPAALGAFLGTYVGIKLKQ
jgi:Na+/glutamate symporter